jgi:hypothetical protein
LVSQNVPATYPKLSVGPPFFVNQESIKKRREAIANEAKRVSSAKVKLGRLVFFWDASYNRRFPVDMKKKALKNLLNAPSADEQRTRLKQNLINSAKKRMNLAREYTVRYLFNHFARNRN